MKTNRLEALSDGVFAIAVTLLVLEVPIPELSAVDLADGRLLEHLIEIWPKILSYVISFLIIGIFWVGHHIMFSYIRKVDRKLLYLNILLLMVISFIPFPAALVGSYGRDQAAVILYGGTLMMAGILFGAIWAYASRNNKLVDKDLSPRIKRKGALVILIAPLVYILAILISFINPTYSLIIYILVPVIYVIPGPVDELIEGVRD